MTIAELKDKIFQVVDDFWNSKERPVLLSLLGSLENASIAKNVKKLGFSLREFLSQEMSESVSVGTHSKNKVLVGVYPKRIGALGQAKLDSLLEENSSVSSSMPRFHKTYWAAFKVSLARTERRYVSISDQPSFRDIGAKEAPPANAVEVDRKFITTSSASSDQDVYSQVVEWAKENDIELDWLTLGFYSKRSSQPENLMLSLLEALDPTDLKRVSVPLDVVQKLLNTK